MNVSKEKGSHLVIIIDMNCNSRLLSDASVYSQWLDSTLSFANSHLLMSPINKLTIIGSNSLHNTILYPNDNESVIIESHEGQYELFTRVMNEVQNKLRTMTGKSKHAIASQSHNTIKSSSLMSGAIGMALCCIQKCKDDYKCSRIAIISSNTDISSAYSFQYMNFMNAFFTAQKLGIVIDVCIAGDDESHGDASSSSSILHQASDLTNGIFLNVQNVSAFLQYLLWSLLPDVETRAKLVLPQRKIISHQAACFCHRTLIEIGFVCSVCLSIFCTFSPICSTCQSSFKLALLPTALTVKKKSKQK